MEIRTTTSAEAVALRPMIKNVRVLTLPYLEFEFCNVYRGTQGKTFPLIHRHPDAVVLFVCKGDYDHVFFVTVAQLLPCLQDMNLADWSMVVFWNGESMGSVSKKDPMSGWTSRTSLLHHPMCRNNRRLHRVMIWTIQVMMIHMWRCLWNDEICRLRTRLLNRILTMIL